MFVVNRHRSVLCTRSVRYLISTCFNRARSVDSVTVCVYINLSNAFANLMAPRKMKLQRVALKVRAKLKQVKAKIGEAEGNGKCLREEQRKLRAKFGEIERQSHRLKAETEMVMKQTATTQIKLALIFNILKAREGGDLIQAATLTRFLRELVAKERADAAADFAPSDRQHYCDQKNR
ncbi:hypothetical protein GQ457_01G056280 [Hibiscus cannabinus]